MKGELNQANMCDCGPQLSQALKQIEKAGTKIHNQGKKK